MLLLTLVFVLALARVLVRSATVLVGACERVGVFGTFFAFVACFVAFFVALGAVGPTVSAVETALVLGWALVPAWG